MSINMVVRVRVCLNGLATAAEWRLIILHLITRTPKIMRFLNMLSSCLLMLFSLKLDYKMKMQTINGIHGIVDLQLLILLSLVIMVDPSLILLVILLIQDRLSHFMLTLPSAAHRLILTPLMIIVLILLLLLLEFLLLLLPV